METETTQSDGRNSLRLTAKGKAAVLLATAALGGVGLPPVIHGAEHLMDRALGAQQAIDQAARHTDQLHASQNINADPNLRTPYGH